MVRVLTVNYLPSILVIITGQPSSGRILKKRENIDMILEKKVDFERLSYLQTYRP